MYREGDNGSFYAGRDWYRNMQFTVTVCFGKIENPPEGASRFRHVWEWSPRWPLTIRRIGSVLEVKYGFGWRRRVRLIQLKSGAYR